MAAAPCARCVYRIVGASTLLQPVALTLERRRGERDPAVWALERGPFDPCAADVKLRHARQHLLPARAVRTQALQPGDVVVFDGLPRQSKQSRLRSYFEKDRTASFACRRHALRKTIRLAEMASPISGF